MVLTLQSILTTVMTMWKERLGDAGADVRENTDLTVLTVTTGL